MTLGDPENRELYDLNADPHEMNNLYGAPAQADRIHELAGRIRAWQDASGDDLVLTVPYAREITYLLGT